MVQCLISPKYVTILNLQGFISIYLYIDRYIYIFSKYIKQTNDSTTRENRQIHYASERF